MPRLSSGLSLKFRALALAGGLLAAAACVEQSDEKPTAEDQDFINKNLLKEPPKPQFAVNADIDGKLVYLGLDSSANPIEPGKDVKLTHYWKVVSAPGRGLAVVHPRQRAGQPAVHQLRPRPGAGQVPGQRSGRTGTSSATSTASGCR